MKKFFLVIAIVGIFFSSCRSKEAQWILIHDDPSLNLYVEKGSIKNVSGSLRRAWVTFVFKQPKNFESKVVQKALSYDEIDCTKKTLQVVQVTFYFTDGTNQSLPEKLDAAPIKPDTMGDIEYNYLCKK